jgi:DNA-directed RNA polymerase specialized sigma24 family protein
MGQPLLNPENPIRDVLYQEIVESLKLLPKMLREVFIRSHYCDKGPREIAHELGLPVENVKLMLKDANEIFYRNLHHFESH